VCPRACALEHKMNALSRPLLFALFWPRGRWGGSSATRCSQRSYCMHRDLPIQSHVTVVPLREIPQRTSFLLRTTASLRRVCCGREMQNQKKKKEFFFVSSHFLYVVWTHVGLDSSILSKVLLPDRCSIPDMQPPHDVKRGLTRCPLLSSRVLLVVYGRPAHL
jgi:hypothetical protein